MSWKPLCLKSQMFINYCAPKITFKCSYYGKSEIFLKFTFTAKLMVSFQHFYNFEEKSPLKC